jgi:hypothetical protein
MVLGRLLPFYQISYTQYHIYLGNTLGSGDSVVKELGIMLSPGNALGSGDSVVKVLRIMLSQGNTLGSGDSVVKEVRIMLSLGNTLGSGDSVVRLLRSFIGVIQEGKGWCNSFTQWWIEKQWWI